MSEVAPVAKGQPKPSCRTPKPRQTEFLDLRAPQPETVSNQKHQLGILMKLLRKKKKIVVIAGAGISVGAGIPDFRSSTGLFTSLRTAKASGKDLFDASVYKNDDLTSSFHDMVRMLHSMASTAQPTEFHQLLATLARERRLLRLYSQNVDCIDTRMEPLKTTVPLQPKGPWPRTIQVHGGLENMNCSKCGWVGPFQPALFVGAEPPDCSECLELESVRDIAGKRSLGVGKLRPRIVLYNEFHPDADAIGAVTRADIRSRPDAVIVVGTSLKVPGVKRIVREMCQSVRDYRGGVSVWLNEGEPPSGKEYSGLFDLVIRGDCEKVATLAKLPRWDSELSSTENESGSEESFLELDLTEAASTGGKLEAQVLHNLPSPSLSPDPQALKPTPTSKKRVAETELGGDKMLTKKARARKKMSDNSKPPTSGAMKVLTKDLDDTSCLPPDSTMKIVFKSVKKTTANQKTKGTGGKKVYKRSARVQIVHSAVLVSNVSPPPSDMPSSARSISIDSLLN